MIGVFTSNQELTIVDAVSLTTVGRISMRDAKPCYNIHHADLARAVC